MVEKAEELVEAGDDGVVDDGIALENVIKHRYSLYRESSNNLETIQVDAPPLHLYQIGEGILNIMKFYI